MSCQFFTPPNLIASITNPCRPGSGPMRNDFRLHLANYQLIGSTVGVLWGIPRLDVETPLLPSQLPMSPQLINWSTRVHKLLSLDPGIYRKQKPQLYPRARVITGDDWRSGLGALCSTATTLSIIHNANSPEISPHSGEVTCLERVLRLLGKIGSNKHGMRLPPHAESGDYITQQIPAKRPRIQHEFLNILSRYQVQ